MKDIELKKKLDEINKLLCANYSSMNDIGVLTGLSGLMLFHFMYAKLKNAEENFDIGVNIIKQCLAKINEGYGRPTFCTGIAGFGWTMDYLNENDFIEVNCDELFKDLDDYLYKCLVDEMKNGNYDYLHGATGIALYFLKRRKNTLIVDRKEKYTKILNHFLLLLKESAEFCSLGYVRWSSEIDIETKARGFNLSLSHGISSLIVFLSKISQYDEFKKNSEPLLVGAINYLRSQKNVSANTHALFPNWVALSGTSTNTSRLAWCYGDLGIACSLWEAAKYLNDKAFQAEVLAIMEFSAHRINAEQTQVVDAGICHGAFGIARIFNKFYAETGNIKSTEALAFWMQDGLKRDLHPDGYAGYKSWNGRSKSWVKDLTVLEGIAGIGLVMLSYLHKDAPNWDECLMIN